MEHKKLITNSLIILALLLFSFSGYMKFNHYSIYAHNDTTKQEILPKIHSKYQGVYIYNLSDDDINQIIRITNHHLYLQSGTELSKFDKSNYIKHLQNQDAHKNKKQSNKQLNQAWNSYIEENQRSSNQTHLNLTVHKIINDKHKIILTGYNQNYTPKQITLYTNNHSLKLKASPFDRATYGLVKNMIFKPTTNINVKHVLNHDKLNPKDINL